MERDEFKHTTNQVPNHRGGAYRRIHRIDNDKWTILLHIENS